MCNLGCRFIRFISDIFDMTFNPFLAIEKFVSIGFQPVAVFVGLVLAVRIVELFKSIEEYPLKLRIIYFLCRSSRLVQCQYRYVSAAICLTRILSVRMSFQSTRRDMRSPVPTTL